MSKVKKAVCYSFCDTFVTSVQPNTVQAYGADNVRVSRNHASAGTSYAYLRIPAGSMPAVGRSCFVTGVTLRLVMKTAPSPMASLCIRKVSGDWAQESITWNNQPESGERVYLSKTLGVGQDGQTYLYDLTSLARSWLQGEGFGIRLETPTNTSMSFYSAEGPAQYRPRLEISYESIAGLSPQLSHEAFDAGRAGSAYVTLLNGHLTAERADTSMNGARLPVSLSHWYNVCYAKKDAFGQGKGWTLSGQPYLYKEWQTSGAGIFPTWYVYTDGDGTRHWFDKEDDEWKDQSGLGLTLTLDETAGTAVITDKKDHRMTFPLPTALFADDEESESVSEYAKVGLLENLSDPHGNTAAFTNTSSRRLTQVMDGAGRITALSWQNDRLASVCAPGDGPVTFVYDASGYLTQAIDPDGGRAEYTYNANGLLSSMRSVYTEDGAERENVRLTFCYTAQSQISAVLVSREGVLISGRKYEYGYLWTEITDLIPVENDPVHDPADPLYGFAEGKKILYHFHQSGDTVSVHDGLGYGRFMRYDSTQPAHHPAQVSKLQKTVVNYLRDHDLSRSLSAMTAWTVIRPDGGSGSVMPSQNQSGLLIIGSGFGISQEVSLTKGKTYTFSAQYSSSAGGQMELQAIYRLADGTEETVSSSSPGNGGGWRRKSVTFTLPQDSTSSTVTVRVMNEGIGHVSAAQLEEGTVVNRYQALRNGDFTDNTGSAPACWAAGVSTGSAWRVYNEQDETKPEGLSQHVLKITGTETTVGGTLTQELRFTGAEDTVFTVGGWMKASQDANCDAKLTVAFLKSGMTDDWHNGEEVKWSPSGGKWQMCCGAVKAPISFDRVRFLLTYKGYDEASFHGLFIYRETFGTSYSYDASANLLSAENPVEEQASARYDIKNNLVSYWPYGRDDTGKRTYFYGLTDQQREKHLVLSETFPTGPVVNYTYNTHGSLTGQDVTGAASDLVIHTETAYDTATENYAVRQTDARGNAAISETDPNLGTLTSVTDARGETVSYAYDTLKRLTETSAPLGSLTRKTETVYGPDDRVREVKHNTTGSVCDVVYTFTYDEGGRQKEVKVGNKKLSEQFYNPDGTLEKTVFGNSTSARPQEVRYRYDGYKRLQGIRYDGAAEDQITYDIDARGLTVRVTDHTKDHTLITEYDAADRPEWSAQRMGGTHLYTVTLSYDSHGNISAVQERAGNDSTFYETLLTWNADNRPVKVEYDRINSSRISYSYDPLGRLTKRTLKLPGRSYETSYTYIPSTFGTGNTTGLFRTITQAGKTLTYSYDACGNITQVKTGALYTKYSYDKLGRLTRVNDQTDLTADPTGTTWVYTYDLGGNIKTKKMYVYTTTVMTGLTPLVTHTLTYSATAWKDKVTKVNGVSITYDNIGNPLNDGAWAYSWEHGRQLRQMAKTDNTQTVSYEYDASGLRTKKTVTDTGSNSTMETGYILSGRNIVHMTQGSHTLHFLYDGQGKPGIVSYDGTLYGYLYNLQGDVIALVDAAGTKVVEYTYDAWGRPTSKTGTLANTLGTIQPFRYRGYVYDEETGLYYLRSRYYNPVWCRFLNADAVFDGTNLFAYCGNSPVLQVDNTGKLAVCFELYMQALIIMKLIPNSDTIRHDYTPILGIFSSSLENELTDSLRHSDQFMQRVYSYISKMEDEKKTSYSDSEPIFFDFDINKHTIQNNDLALGVGRLESLPISVTKCFTALGKTLYRVDYTIIDRFDFADFSEEKRDTFIIWLNQNLGYYPQEKGIINAFDWKCSGCFYFIN